MRTLNSMWRLKFLLALIGVAVVLMAFLLVEGRSIRVPADSVLRLTAWWVSPLVAYVIFCRSRQAAFLIGLGFLGFEVIALVGLYTNDSSTTALGLFTIPVLLWVGVLVALSIETIVLTSLGWRTFYRASPTERDGSR